MDKYQIDKLRQEFDISPYVPDEKVVLECVKALRDNTEQIKQMLAETHKQNTTPKATTSLTDAENKKADGVKEMVIVGFTVICLIIFLNWLDPF